MEELIDLQKHKKARIAVVVAQCFGLVAAMMFVNNFLLNYFTKTGFSDNTTLRLLSLPSLFALFIIPIAYFCDKIGAKKIGIIGQILMVFGFSLLGISSTLNEHGKVIAVLGLIFYCVGWTLFGSGWFALLNAIVPAEIRGRFFGTLRTSWAVFAIFMGFLISKVLGWYPSIETYRYILFVAAAFMAIRLVIYIKHLPESISKKEDREKFLPAIKVILQSKNFLPFCSYIFLLTLFTAFCPFLFGLLEKNVLGFSEEDCVFAGTAVLLGSIPGFFLGGYIVDKFGCRIVFLISHFSFAVILFSFLFRGFFPEESMVWIVSSLAFAFGTIQGSNGIAITSEMMAVIPEKNKSLSTGIVVSTIGIGAGLSSFILSFLFENNVFAESWSFLGLEQSKYDVVLFLSSIMILFLTITLGLIPSVVNKKQWIPNQ